MNIEQTTETTTKLKDRREVDSLLECLLFLSKYHKRETSKESIISGLPLYKSLMNINMFFDVSKRMGFAAKIVKRDIPNVTKLALPSILILEKGRHCVLLNYDTIKNEAEVILPGLSEGVTIISLEKLKSEHTGELIIIRPEFNFNNKVENQIVIEQPKKWFWGTLKKNIDIYKQVIIISLFINLFILATPLFTMNVYDRVLPNNAIATLWALFVGIAVVMAFDLTMKVLRSYFLGVASKRADTTISNRIFNQVLNIKIEAKPGSTGQFVSRLQSFESVRDFFTSATIAAAVDFPFAIIFIGVIFYIGGPLGYISAITVLISTTLSWYLQRPLRELIEKTVKEEQLKHTILIEAVTGLEIIKSVRAQNRMRNYWDKSINKTIHYTDKSHFLSQSITYLAAFISQFSSILIVAGGVYLSKSGDITMGAIIACMILNGRVLAPVSQLVGLIIKYDKTMLSLKNLDEIMKMPLEKENKTYISRPNLKGTIEFKDVQFSYKEQNHQTLKNINLSIKQGEKVAILGKVGSGKTTLVKLIMGLYEPSKGSVLIDDVDIRQIDPVDLRKSIGCVPQEPFLFMGTIKDNITIGEQYISDEQVLKASKISGLNEFLGKHEAGFDLIVGERGEGLSGGERQIVTLARALISEPNMLILDEPTNLMDGQTEKNFIDKIQQIVENKTLIVVTHKHSLLRLVDRVIIVENGQIILDEPKENILDKIGGIPHG